MFYHYQVPQAEGVFEQQLGRAVGTMSNIRAGLLMYASRYFGKEGRDFRVIVDPAQPMPVAQEIGTGRRIVIRPRG